MTFDGIERFGVDTLPYQDIDRCRLVRRDSDEVTVMRSVETE